MAGGGGGGSLRPADSPVEPHGGLTDVGDGTSAAATDDFTPGY